MVKARERAAVALLASSALTLAACGGGGDSPATGSGATGGSAGGTLYYLTKRPAEHLDPQRTYIGRDLSNMNRLYARGLVQFPATTDEKKAAQPVPDLATDTGRVSDGGRTWAFTLKEGVTWEDGKPVTCADLAYGTSRTFATDTITGGPNYVFAYLPSVAKAYAGPYKGTGQAAYDRAVSCSADNRTITYRFEKPWADFPLAIASLRCFDPYRKDKDLGDKSNYVVFSNGPYKLQGQWRKGTGGTFVRNTAYDPATDGIRRALPDRIVFVEGLTNEIINQRLIADGGNDRFAVTDRAIPPAFYDQVSGKVAERSVIVDSPYTDYLAPNFNTMTNQKVRQALALATDRAGYATALGGERAAVPSSSVVNPSIPGYRANSAFTAPTSGDPGAARTLLEETGVAVPYPLRYTYSGGTPTTDNAAAALKAGWDKAGFATTLVPLTDTYYDVIQNVHYEGGDVIWGGWGADWPGMATVLPALFDSRVNLNATTNGQDYGNYRDDRANALMDEAAAKPTLQEQQAAYQALDVHLGEQVAYIPLTVTRFNFLHGSLVTDYVTSGASNGYPDLGAVGVRAP